VQPAAVAALVGNAAILAYLLATALVMTMALCFAEAGSRVTHTGGGYAYVQRAFGGWAGTVEAALLWLSCGAAAAAIADALVGTLAVLIPLLAQSIPRAATLIALFATFAAVNVKGAREGGRTVAVLTVLKLLPLAALVIWGASAVRLDHYTLSELPDATSFGRTALLLLFALTGFESAVLTSGELANPARTLPMGVTLGVMLSAAIYVVVHLVAQGVLGPELAHFQAAPLAEVASRVFGGAGRTLILVAAAVSMLGFMSGDLLSNPRVVYALAANGMMPRMLARVHSRYGTPVAAIVTYALLACMLSLFGGFTRLAIFSSVATLIMDLGVVLAAVRLRQLGVHADVPPVRLPGGWLIPGIATLLIATLLCAVTREELLAVGGFIVLCRCTMPSGRGGARLEPWMPSTLRPFDSSTL
jgi:amino acid transporter